MSNGLPEVARWILDFGAAHKFLVYAAIVFLACAEGPWLALILGAFVRLSYFNFVPVYVCLMLGDLIGDAAWYYVGRRYGLGFVTRYGKHFDIAESSVQRMTRLFHRHKDWVLFLSKISNGFGLAIVTLMTAGMVRIPFGRYMLVNMLGQFLWTGLLMGTGYSFTHLYVTVHGVLARVSVVAAVVVLAVVGYRLWKHLCASAQKKAI
jgi:membrane-associated protein